MHEDMNRRILGSEAGHRDRWLALLHKYGVGDPKSLHLMEIPGGLVQATLGEPPGRICLDGTPGHVLMFNLSPVQALRQTRDGRSFTSNMLHGEMTLMPSGVPSQWSWNSTCDRLDVIISPDVFGDNFAVVDRFLFRDPEMEMLCHGLYRAVSLDSMTDRLYVESLVAQLAVLIRQRHSTASVALRIPPSSGLTRNQARRVRVLDYIESHLSRELTLGQLARTAGLSLYHFARMFKRTLGMAPHRYVLQRRVERAKGMLRSSGASLVEISLSTGFASQSHFTSTFRRLVGPTPTEFKGRSRSNRS